MDRWKWPECKFLGPTPDQLTRKLGWSQQSVLFLDRSSSNLWGYRRAGEWCSKIGSAGL